jgi:hypothetical protein
MEIDYQIQVVSFFCLIIRIDKRLLPKVSPSSYHKKLTESIFEVKPGVNGSGWFLVLKLEMNNSENILRNGSQTQKSASFLYLDSREISVSFLDFRGLLDLLHTANEFANAKARSVDVLLPIRPLWLSFSPDIPHIHIIRNCLHIGQVSLNLPPTIVSTTNYQLMVFVRKMSTFFPVSVVKIDVKLLTW